MRVGFAGGPLDGRRATWGETPRTVVSTDVDDEVEHVIYELQQQIGSGTGRGPITLRSAVYVPQGTTDSDALELIRALFANMVIGD